MRDDSPELLRWRADILLDEMMLGAVDIAAGRPDSVPSDAGSPTASSLSGPESTAAIRADAGAFEGGPRSASSSPIQRESKDSLLSPASQRSFNSGSIDAESQSDPWRIDVASSDWRGSTGSPNLQASATQNSRPAGPQDLPSPEMSPDLPSGSSNNMLRPPSASAALSEARSVTENPPRDADSGVAAWSVRQMEQPVARRELRSNLLPRESQFDARGHFQEIDRLEAEVEMTLPAEHEWSVRSRHLLAKATDILQNSPQRSAEVDYYLQQVRSILERAQQTYRWSLIYAKRLKIYLGSWALLSVVVIVASLLYAEPLVEILSPDSSATSIYWMQNFIALTITVFAGTLGAAIGALRNMLFYRSVGRGFVDRKYSLRGLFLPLMAGLFGLFIYLLFGIIYYFADIEPLQNLIVVGVPALLAFAFGLAQELLYGTAG